MEPQNTFKYPFPISESGMVSIQLFRQTDDEAIEVEGVRNEIKYEIPDDGNCLVKQETEDIPNEATECSDFPVMDIKIEVSDVFAVKIENTPEDNGIEETSSQSTNSQKKRIRPAKKLNKDSDKNYVGRSTTASRKKEETSPRPKRARKKTEFFTHETAEAAPQKKATPSTSPRVQINMGTPSADDPHFQCSKCEQSFVTEYVRQFHLNTFHGPEVFRCSECNWGFNVWDDLSRHHLFHEITKNYRCQCDVCWQRFSTRIGLRDHMKLFHQIPQPPEPPMCKICDKIFDNRKNLHEHYDKSHWKPPSYKCSKCLKGFELIDDFQRHLLTHRKDQAGKKVRK